MAICVVSLVSHGRPCSNEEWMGAAAAGLWVCSFFVSPTNM
jgi:hypothetical protein